MTRNIWALLVGIDSYEPPLPPLHGCVKDIEAIAQLLRKRGPAEDHINIRMLRNGEASRANVISAFREHLGAAGENDTSLFYYSGHGSQEPALPEDAEIEPDGLNETLVLHDSRRPGVYDLADKELAQLVADVSARGTHVIVVLDCCHSGSGVRAPLEDGIAIRRAPASTRNRPAESYLATSGVSRAPAREGPDWLNLDARYVLLAACRSDQTAKEVRVGGDVRGALSAALERVLYRTAGTASYQDVQAWVAAGVRNLAADQTPMLESPVPGDIRLPFLGGSVAPAKPLLTVSHIENRGWVLDAGLVQGIPAPAIGQAPTALTLHPLVIGAVLLSPAQEDALATATVVTVGAATSTLDVVASTGALDPAATYRAVIRRLPVTPLALSVEGDPALVSLLRSALADSALVTVDGGGQPDLHILATTENVRLTRPDAERALVADEMPSREGLRRIWQAVEHVARWSLIYDRSNPDSAIPVGAVDLTCLDEDGTELSAHAGTVERWYRQENGRAMQPTMKVRLRNRSDRRFYYALLALSELYGVVSLLPGGGVWLDPGEEAFPPGKDGRPVLYLNVPDGQERTTDVLKLIVSTEEFDAQQLQQDDLRAPARDRGPQAVAKGIGTAPELPAAASDWTTCEISVATVRPGDFHSVGATIKAPLAPGVFVLEHPSLRARVRLATRPTASRDAIVPLLPPLLVDEPSLTEPYAFAGTRAAGSEPSVLELSDVVNAQAVTAEDPLVIAVDGVLAPGEHVLPVAFDGEDYLPLGYSRDNHDRTEICLTRLPPPSEQLTRSLGGSLKILFRKLVLRPLGGKYDYPRLSLVTFGDEGEPRYDHDAVRISAAISTAERMLLVVHGIIGDTRGIVAAVARTDVLDGYDAVLAYDYENINTPVQETARALAQRLRSIGVVPGGRRIDVLAHSMGGLVSRWLIEREDGAGMVDRLVVCGTPSGGSPRPQLEHLATSSLALALNGLSGLAGPLALASNAFGFLVQTVEKVDVTLDSMRPGSDLLEALAASPQPGVTYMAVAGDRPFGPDSDPGRARRILEKLRVPQLVLDAVFGDAANDLAVSVTSATTFGSAWPASPEHLHADCSHLTYFASREGIGAVQQALVVPP